MTRRCVVTGLGHVGAHGCGRDGLAAALAKSEVSPSPVENRVDFDGMESTAARAAFVVRDSLDEWLDPRAARRLSAASKFAVAAARMALHDAALDSLEADGSESSVHIATALGPARSTEALLGQIFRENPESASPLHFMESVANAPAAQVAIALAAHGPNSSVTQREAGPLLALGEGAREIIAGRTDRAIVGSVDELTPLSHAVFDRFNALARSDGEVERGRPFDRDRDGFLMAEGATTWLLEEESIARARGARVIAEVEVSVRANDPTASVASWGTGSDALAARLRSQLARADIDLGAIDAWVASAAGSRRGDALEAGVIGALYPDPETRPVVFAPKAVTGEYGGGYLAAALLIAEGTNVGPTPGFANVDPTLGIEPHGHRLAVDAARAGTGRFLLSAFAAGGAVAWTCLRRR